MDYHSQTSALMVGDPEVGLVMYMGSRKNITELLFAREEVKMDIGWAFAWRERNKTCGISSTKYS